MKDSIRAKCQRLWIKAAAGEDITLRFNTMSELERTKFALYDSCRKTDDLELAAARELVEVRRDKEAISLIISRKDRNPYHAELEKQLDDVLGDEGREVGKSAIEWSLNLFKEKLEPEPESRPATPYFNRKEE